MFFLNSIYLIFTLSLITVLFTAIYYYKSQKYEFINTVGFYFCSIIILTSAFILIEFIVIKEVEHHLSIIFTLEMVLILILFTWIYYIVYKRSEGKTFYIYTTIILFFSHIFISGLFLPFLTGTIITAFIGIIIFISIVKINEYRKQLYFLFLAGWYIYISQVLNVLFFGLISLLIIIAIVSLGYRPVAGRLISIYHSMRTLSNSYLPKKGLNLDSKRRGKKRPLFWMNKVIISQIGRKGKLENKKFQTWLQDYSRNKKCMRVQIILNKDQFEISFLIKTRTRSEGIQKGNQILTDLKSTYRGLDGKLEHFEVDNRFLYEKEKWWVLKFPKAPYKQRIDLINRLSILFGEDRHKVKLLIIWKKTFPKKILEQRAKIMALKYKDSIEKNTYLKMWRDSLFQVKIYINYEVLGKNLNSKSPEFHAMKGRIKSLENLIRNEKKMARIKRVSCGARADFLRGNLYSKLYLTPMSCDFTFNDKMPFHVPVGLKKQVINWSLHTKNNFNFPVGRWIDEFGRLRENLLYVKVDDFVQGGIIIGGIGTGKSYFMGYINKCISKVRPDVGILILNFKRELEVNIYAADIIYKFGKDFNVPYILPLDSNKMGEEIIQVSKGIMGSIGFDEEAVYACKQVLENYIIDNNGPPESIVELLKLVRDYFFEEGHNYDEKYRAKITSALNTRINAQLSNPVLIKALNPFERVGNWYEDWLNCKIVQLDLSSCNEWEQRLISILILQTIVTLTPEAGVKGLKGLIEIDEAHRLLKKLTSPGKHKSDDYIACEQIIKRFQLLLGEFRDRGISFLNAEQRADILDDSATSLPNLRFLLHQNLSSVERITKDPQNIETIIRLENRYCVLDRGPTGEFFSFLIADYFPKKRSNNEMIKISKVLCPKCENVVDIAKQICPFCNNRLNFEK